jgi:hypothetical protein
MDAKYVALPAEPMTAAKVAAGQSHVRRICNHCLSHRLCICFFLMLQVSIIKFSCTITKH